MIRLLPITWMWLTIIISIINIIIIIIRDDLLATISSNKRENDQMSLRNVGIIREAAKKSSFFSGPATNFPNLKQNIFYYKFFFEGGGMISLVTEIQKRINMAL